MGAHAHIHLANDGPLEIGAPELDLVKAYRRLWNERAELHPGTGAYERIEAEMAIVLSNYRDRVEVYARTKDDAFLMTACARIQASYGKVTLVVEPLNAVIERVFRAELAHRSEGRVAAAEATARMATEARSLGARRHRGGGQAEDVPLGLRARWMYFGRSY